MASGAHRAPVYGIDAVRFLAACAVMLYHFSAKPFLTPDASSLHTVLAGLEPRAPAGAVWWGWIGVQVFFVISGAVISYSARGARPGRFFVGRVARLWPAMLICAPTIAVLNLGWWGHGALQEAGLLARSLLFWPAGPWVTGQIWTLPIEIVFYGVVWLLIAATREPPLRLVAWAIGTASCGYWLLVSTGAAEQSGFHTLLLFEHGVYFALGMAIMQAGLDGAVKGAWALVALCVAGAWLQIAATTAREMPGFDFPPAVPYAIWLSVCAAIWISVAWREPVAARIERSPRLARGLRSAGLATFPLYLIHIQPGGLLLAGLVRRGAPTWAAVGAASMLALLLAFAVALWFEPPVHRAVKQGLEAGLARTGRLLPSRTVTG